MTQATMAAVEQSAVRKISWRLVPFVALMFFINFLDRTAISFAGPNGMAQDLGLTAVQFGLASGVFFIGYILLEVPSNLALHRFGARRWLARIMISWGIVSLLFTWVSSVPGLYGLRLLLGIAEAGFFPGAILYLSMWVPARHRSKILSLFYLAQPLTVVFGAPLAAAFIEQHGLFGLAGWRVMFLGVSIPAILIGIMALLWLVDSPRQAKWLTSEEKTWLTNELEAESNAKQQKGHQSLRSVMGNGRVWMLCLIYFGFIYGLYALAFFLPTIIGGFQQQFGTTFNVMQKGIITGVPYLVAAVVMFFWSRDASRRGCKTWHIAIPALAGAISVPLALYMDSPFTTILVIAITASSIFSALPNFWTLPTQFLSGASAAAAIALINTLGNVAGFSAGYITGALHDATQSYTVPMFVVGGFMLLSAVLMLLLNRSRQIQPTSLAQEQ
ncbi:MAG: MFS transporter [Enterobacterales bacterium endosymbiont of Blomia tropicalis]|uniref:MFS transporter n=1 Tax=Mixta mediterraneensis TaxID=2758443 RepID=UPI0025A77F42|nr:MFS transporter [Mixta mediterraneensis]MDL4912872.1 MFS transporter [Mixta mediterraneensis]